MQKFPGRSTVAQATKTRRFCPNRPPVYRRRLCRRRLVMPGERVCSLRRRHVRVRGNDRLPGDVVRARCAPGPGLHNRRAMCNLYSLTKGQSAIRDLFSVRARSRRQPAVVSVDLSRPDRADRAARSGRRARTRHGAVGHARAAAIRRPAGDQHPQRREPALARMARRAKPLRRSGDVVLRICRHHAAQDADLVCARRGPAAVRFAGLWTRWRGVRGPKSAPVEGEHELYGILTTEANDVIAPIHPRPCRSS